MIIIIVIVILTIVILIGILLIIVIVIVMARTSAPLNSSFVYAWQVNGFKGAYKHRGRFCRTLVTVEKGRRVPENETKRNIVGGRGLPGLPTCHYNVIVNW